MPPPPLPQRLTMTSPPMQPVADRRGDSRYSDISMHAGCNAFPTCISEDTEGHLIHTGGPAGVVRGRKEGDSSPSKRKSTSTEHSDHYIRTKLRRRT